MSFLNKIRLVLWVIAIAGAATAYLDYDRLVNGEIPVFCKKEYNQSEKIETFRGLFYIADRQVKYDTREQLYISSNVRYRYLNKTLKIDNPIPYKQNDFVLYITPSLYCPSVRSYQELEGKRVMIDCIASIKIKKSNESVSKDLNEVLAEDPSVLDDITLKMTFTGIEDDHTTERYKTTGNGFSNIPFYIYKCHKGESYRDVYITTNSNRRNYCG